MYKFIKEIDEDNPYDDTQIIINVPDSHIDMLNLVRVFESFLRACDFDFEGRLMYIKKPHVTDIRGDE